MPLFLILSAPTWLLMFSLVTKGQNLRIRSFGKSALTLTFNRHLLHHISRKILEILSHLAGHLQGTWEDWLSHVATSINDSVNSSTGKTPHYILYGFEKRLPHDVLVPSPVPLYSPDDYSKLQLHCFQTIRDSVRKKLKASWEEILHKQHSQATPVHLDIGDSVMKRAPDRSCKLTPKLSGPFLSTAKLHGNKFKILDPNTNVSEVVHVDHLKEVSASLTSAAVPSPPSTIDLPSPPDLQPSHRYWLWSAEHHWSVSFEGQCFFNPCCCAFSPISYWSSFTTWPSAFSQILVTVTWMSLISFLSFPPSLPLQGVRTS